MDSIPQKQCYRCKTILPHTAEFFVVRSKKEGTLRGECRTCYHARQVKWREDNKEHYLDYHKNYRTEHAEQVSAVKADWYKRNKIRIKPRMLATSKAWKENNPEKVRLQKRASQSRRKATIRHVGGTYTEADVMLQLKGQNGKCWWCSKSIVGAYHVDHRIALSRGGTNWPSNICISCPDCNQSKYDKMPWEWNGRLL